MAKCLECSKEFIPNNYRTDLCRFCRCFSQTNNVSNNNSEVSMTNSNNNTKTFLARIKFQEILLKEGFLYSEKYLFAGTTDFAFLDFKNKVVVTDFKSASSPRNEDTIHKFGLQGGAYAIAFEEIYSIPVDRIEIWISHPDGVQAITVDGETLNDRKNEFLDYCKKYHEMWETEKIEKF